MKKEKLVIVSGIKWDADTKEELEGVSTTVTFTLSIDEFNDFYDNEDEDGFEELIADKISDISGFCHDGWGEYRAEDKVA